MHRNDSLTIRPVQPVEQQAARALILDGLAERWGNLDPGKNPDLDDILTHYSRGVFLVAYLGDELVRKARAAGYKRVVLETTATWTDTVAFYRQRGFRSLGMRDGDHHFEREI